jgi:hypothetical protein
MRDNPSISDDKSTTKAFRLCINSDHCDRLLVESKWPAYVSVSEWFFKPVDQAKQLRVNNANSASTSDAIDDAPVANVDDGNTSIVIDVNVDADADDTLIMNDHSQGPSGQLTSSYS